MPVLLQNTMLPIGSNVFMTFAWYAHLKDMSSPGTAGSCLVSRGAD